MWTLVAVLACSEPAEVKGEPVVADTGDDTGEPVAETGDTAHTGDTAEPTDTGDSTDTGDTADTAEPLEGTCLLVHEEHAWFGETVSYVDYAYDADGHLVEEASWSDWEDRYAGEPVLTVTTWSYDAEGRVEVKEVAEDWGPDGDWDMRWAYLYAYDDAGRVLTEDYDWDHDGAERRTSYVYDDAGDLVSEEETQLATGEVLSRETWTWEEAGRPLSDTWWDVDAGVPAWTRTYAYDDAGNLVTMEVDQDADGAVDSRETWTWDADGHLLSETTATGDGTVQRVYVYVYDGDGKLVVEGEDRSLDGVADRFVSTYTYDDEGRLVTESGDSEGDGALDRAVWTAYDGAGRVALELGIDEDRAVSSVWRFTYDAWGNLALEERDTDVDGVVDSPSTYVWDCVP